MINMGAYTDHIPRESAGVQFTPCLIRGQNLRHVKHQSAAPLTADPLTAGSRRGGTPVQSARLPGDLPYLCLQDFTTTLCNSTNGIGERRCLGFFEDVCFDAGRGDTPEMHQRPFYNPILLLAFKTHACLLPQQRI